MVVRPRAPDRACRRDGTPKEGPGSGAIATVVEGPGGTSGFFERAYDAASATVELRYAFREDLPAWIPEDEPVVDQMGADVVLSPLYSTERVCAFGSESLGLPELLARYLELRAVGES
jgi:hypothetical protein